VSFSACLIERFESPGSICRTSSFAAAGSAKQAANKQVEIMQKNFFLWKGNRETTSEKSLYFINYSFPSAIQLI